MKKRKRTYITEIFIVILLIFLSFFIIDGKKFYTISNDDVLEYNEDLLYQSMPTAKNVDLLLNKDFNHTSLFVYKLDDTYAVFSYNKSLFLNRSILNSYTYQLKDLNEYKITVSNQIYDNNFSISSVNNKIEVENNAKRNKSLPLNLINITVTILIIVSIYFVGNKLIKNNKKDE